MIGNKYIVWLCAFFIFPLYSQDSSNTLSDVQCAIQCLSCETNRRIVQAQVGVPFFVSVRFMSTNPIDDAIIERVHVPGFDRVSVIQKRTQSSARMINNVSEYEKNIVYTIRCEDPGSYVFGPIAGHSNSCEINATLEAPKELVSSGSESQNIAKPYLELIVDQPEFVGQYVAYKIIFKHSVKQDISLVHDLVPRGEHMRVRPEKAYKQRVKDGEQAYVEYIWQGTIAFEKAGQYRVGPLACTYSCPQENGMQRMLPSFMHFGPFGSVKKKIYSNPVIVSVAPLPETDLPFTGLVGTNISVALKCDVSSHDSLAQGDAFSCSLEFFGESDFERFNAPDLIMPDSCRQYKSACKNMPNHKQCEYTVQVLDSGDITIPAQKYVYFDFKDKCYKTIETQLINFFVQKKDSAEVQVVMPEDTVPNTQEHDVQKSELCVSCMRLWSCNWIVLVILLCILPVLTYCVWGAHWCYKIFENFRWYRRQKTLFYKLEKSGNCAKLADFVYTLQAEAPSHFLTKDFSDVCKRLETYRYSAGVGSHVLCSESNYNELFNLVEETFFNKKFCALLRGAGCLILLLSIVGFAQAFGSELAVSESVKKCKKIAQLRVLQWHAGYPEYQKIDQEIVECIDAYKRDGDVLHNNSDDRPLAFSLCIWLMPWIFWQVILLALCICFWFWRSRIVLVLILCCGMVVGYGYSTRYVSRICVCSDACQMYTGPGKTFQSCGFLAQFDQGYQTKCIIDDTGQAWGLVFLRDIVGWVKQEDVYTYTIEHELRDL